MAFEPEHLTIVIPDSGPRAAVATYTTTDTFEETLANGYFDDSLLRSGDALLIEASDATWFCQVASADDQHGIRISKAIHLK